MHHRSLLSIIYQSLPCIHHLSVLSINLPSIKLFSCTTYHHAIISINPSTHHLSIHPCLLSNVYLHYHLWIHLYLPSIDLPFLWIHPPIIYLHIQLSRLSTYPFTHRHLSSRINLSICPQSTYPSICVYNLPIHHLSQLFIHRLSLLPTYHLSIGLSLPSITDQPIYLHYHLSIYHFYQSSHPSTIYPYIYPPIQPSSVYNVYLPTHSTSIYRVSLPTHSTTVCLSSLSAHTFNNHLSCLSTHPFNHCLSIKSVCAHIQPSSIMSIYPPIQPASVYHVYLPTHSTTA